MGDFPRSPRTTSAQARSAIVESLPCDWMIYEEMSRSGRFCHVKTVTLVNPITVVLFSGPARLPMDVINEAESKILLSVSVRFLFLFSFITYF